MDELIERGPNVIPYLTSRIESATASDERLRERLTQVIEEIELKRILGGRFQDFEAARTIPERLNLLRTCGDSGRFSPQAVLGAAILRALVLPGQGREEKLFLLKIIRSEGLVICTHVVRHFLGDEDSEVRQAAVETLVDLNTNDADLLSRCLEDSEPGVRHIAALALVRKCRYESWRKIARLAAKGDRAMAGAVAVLGEQGRTDYAPEISYFISSDWILISKLDIPILVHFLSERWISAFADLTLEQDESVSARARKALQVLEGLHGLRGSPSVRELIDSRLNQLKTDGSAGR